MNRFRNYILTMFGALSVLAMAGRTADDAWNLYYDGDIEAAASLSDSIAQAQPKNSAMFYLHALCQHTLGDPITAKDFYKQAKAKGHPDAAASLAEIAILDYRPDEAMSLVKDYKNLKAKAKGSADNPLAAQVERQVGVMRTMLERVEDIVIIDSINVDAQSFFEAYRLTPESGSIRPMTDLPINIADNGGTVFESEDGHTLLYADYDPANDASTNLYVTHWLNDGTWDAPQLLGDNLNLGGLANYPFLMPDGQTLYFAADNDESLGGYDIFITRDNGDGFLPPQNIGMPYNSPFDDYMLAIDETTGIGWWATDRNQIEGMVTIYMFIPSDLRKNIDVDSPDLMSRARIASIADTQDDENYTEYLQKIARIKPNVATEEILFDFSLPDGSVAHNFDQLPSSARDAMATYLNAMADFQDLENELARLRETYAAGDISVAGEITRLERRLENARGALRESSNNVVKSL